MKYKTIKTKDKRQKTKDKRQKTKDKRQKTKDKRQKTKDKKSVNSYTFFLYIRHLSSMSYFKYGNNLHNSISYLDHNNDFILYSFYFSL